MDNEQQEKKGRGRPVIYTDVERKQRKKEYDLRYIANRRKTDDVFRDAQREHSKRMYTQRKAREPNL